jgi:paxillin
MTTSSYMSEEQMGQQSHVSPSIQARRALFGSSRSGECPAFQEEDSQLVPTASYLKDLRTNKTRPIGSRPPPPSKFGSLRRTETETTSATTTTDDDRPTLPQSNSMPAMIPQAKLHHRPGVAGRNSPFAGRPLARSPSAAPSSLSKDEPFGKPESSRSQSGMYMEQGSRWMEKQEAQSLRAALEDMDIAEEQKIHKEAQDEAAELVWKHRNPDSPFANPEAPYVNPDIKKDYTSHLERGSYSRSRSRDSAPSASTRAPMSNSHRPSLDSSFSGKGTSLENTPKASEPTFPVARSASGSSPGKNYGDLAAAVKKDIDTARRRTSSGNKRVLSSEKKVFMHPDDKIFEDPQEEPTPPKKQQPVIPIPDLRPVPSPIQTVPSLARKNPFARVRMQQERLDRLDRSQSAPVLPPSAMKINRIEIQRNPPSQSRNAGYTSNEALPLTPTTSTTHVEDDATTPQSSPTKDGKEIRSDDIRAATSKQRSARSPNLPQPTAVSDKLGRPIVSFDQSWKQTKEIVLEETRVPAIASTPSASITPPRTSRVSDTPRSSPFNRQAIPKIDPPRESGYRIPHVPTPIINASGRSTSPMPTIPTIIVPDDPSVPSIVLSEEPDIASAIPVFPAAPTINTEPVPTPMKRPSVSVSGPSAMSRPPVRPSRTVAPAINFEPPLQPMRPVAPSISVDGPGFSTAPIASLPLSTAPHRPLPTPTQHSPLYHHANTSPHPKSTPHYTPSLRQSRALCAHCALPISGRVLSAGGQRLHPSCFNCHECDTNLEHVAFHPEPDTKRVARLERIAARQTGHIPEHITTNELYETEEADGEPSMRFYCALDFHEMFSPRCKSCKTPIEGEVIVACGAEWHAGHFFCAQCGDPFDASTPFVEKEGYAWCCDCHTNRYSAKCRKCRKPVTDVVVKALGSEWHANCFCCLVSGLSSYLLFESDSCDIDADYVFLQECGGEFEDGRYFLRGESDDPVCVKCEERRLKA